MARNARSQRAASRGRVLPLVDLGMTCDLSATCSKREHVRADSSLPTPCRGEDSLHVSRSRIDSAGRR